MRFLFVRVIREFHDHVRGLLTLYSDLYDFVHVVLVTLYSDLYDFVHAVLVTLYSDLYDCIHVVLVTLYSYMLKHYVIYANWSVRLCT